MICLTRIQGHTRQILRLQDRQVRGAMSATHNGQQLDLDSMAQYALSSEAPQQTSIFQPRAIQLFDAYIPNTYDHNPIIANIGNHHHRSAGGDVIKDVEAIVAALSRNQPTLQLSASLVRQLLSDAIQGVMEYVRADLAALRGVH